MEMGDLPWRKVADQAQEAFDTLQLPVTHVKLDRDSLRQARQDLRAGWSALNWSGRSRSVAALVRYLGRRDRRSGPGWRRDRQVHRPGLAAGRASGGRL